MAHSLALLPRGYINLEYLLIGALSVFLPRSAVFLLIFLESLADLVCAVSQTYMLSPKDLVESLRSLRSLPTFRTLEIVVVFILLFVICAAVTHVQPRVEDRLWVLSNFLFLIGIFIPAAILTGQNPFKPLDVMYTHKRMARAPVLSLASSAVYFYRIGLAAHGTGSGGMNSASSYAMAFLNHPSAAKSPDVVLIVVESWGLSLDAHLAQALSAPYDDPSVARKYDVSYGAVPFGGSTVPGEGRELCHSTMGFNLLVASPESLHGCLPSLFHARNYDNFAIHGYSGSMFERKAWYPKIGFDRIWFRADLDRMGLPECDGAFPGTCDAAIAGWIGSSLLSVDTRKPRFIYWVTLNSHLPVPAHPNLTVDGVCSTLLPLRDSVPMCSWFRLVRNVHHSVQQLVLIPSARPTVFVVVGDHAPPFADPKLRRIFSATDVPYVLLTPRTAAAR
jgi:phosphoglycerol transferase MdoB-like AlkP superfamily enzyme